MKEIINFLFPTLGVFYNGFYGVKGYRWFGYVKGEVIRRVYQNGYKVGENVKLTSNGFFYIKKHEDFPFDLYDRY